MYEAAQDQRRQPQRTRQTLSRRFRHLEAAETYRKLGISFWDYLGERFGAHGDVATRPDFIRERAAAESAAT
jgi:hypothetical protein